MKSNVLPTLLIIAAIGLFFTYTNPKYAGQTNSTVFSEKTIKELKEDEVRYNEALNKTAEIRQRRDDLLDSFNAVPENIREDLKKLLPDHVDSVRLVIDINKLANIHGISMRDVTITSGKTGSDNSKRETVAQVPNGAAVTFSSVSETPGYVGSRKAEKESVELGFSVVGDYNNFKSFIVSLEKSLRVLDVTSLSFTSDETGEYEYDIKIRTYLLK